MKQTGAEHREEEEELADTVSYQEQHQSLYDDSHGDDLTKDIHRFVHQYDLSEHLETFEKASSCLREGDDPGSSPKLSQDEITALSDESQHKWRQPRLMYLTIVATALGAMGQGWAQTGINGANLFFPQAFGIDSKTARNALILGVINCGIYLSNGLLGSWLVAPLNDRFGRRGAVFGAASISLLFNIAGALTMNWQQLLCCRLVLGCALAVISSTLNVFAAECAPAIIRGGLAVSWQMFCAFGIFTGFVFNVTVNDIGPMNWRYQIGAPALPAIPLLILIYVCPESPSWFIKGTDDYRSAYSSLRRLRNTDLQAAKELYATYLQRKHYTASANRKTSYLSSITELFTISRIRRATVAAYATMISQQLCGINIVAFYSSTIFVEAKFSQHAALMASTVFGFLNFIFAFPAIWTMDTLGRRVLLLSTLPFMAITMGIAGISFSVPDSTGNIRLWILTSMIYIFCILYSPGMGPVPAAYSAEVFPLTHREIGTSSAVAMTSLFASILSLTFPWLLNTLGSQGSFLLYAALNVLAFALVFFLVPETKGRTLEELDSVFDISSRQFIKYQIRDYVPWWISRYILRRKDVELKQLGVHPSGEYQVLEQDDDHDEENDV